MKLLTALPLAPLHLQQWLKMIRKPLVVAAIVAALTSLLTLALFSLNPLTNTAM